VKRPVLIYGAAVLATIAATLLRMLLAPVVGTGLPFATYFVATIFVVWYGGFRPAALNILLSVAAGSYFFISPATTSPLFVTTRGDRIAVVGFVVVSLAVTLLLDLQRRTLGRVEQEAARRRSAENAERQQRQWLETTLASIGDAVLATDDEGKIMFMNRVACELTGWTIEQARGLLLRSVFHIVNEQTGEDAENPLDTVMKGRVIVGLPDHTLLVSKDGRRIPVDDSGAPIQRDDRMLGAVLVFRDVTERRRAQRQIEQSERRYRLLFESNPQPMWVYDLDSLAFLAVNTAAVRQYGYSAEEFLRMTESDIRPSEDIPALVEDVQQPTRLHRDGPCRHQKRDGTIISVEITSHPIEFEGHKACLVLATDITERKNLEEQFYQAQRLESVGRLAGGVAHDFNNLLTVINGYAAMLLSKLPLADPLTQMVAEISAAGQRAAALTEQLLTFSRRQLVQPKVLNLNHVIVDIDKMLRRLIGEDIELNINLSPNLENILADGGQLQQVIMNLAVNARDAMPQGGSLIIETCNTVLGENYCASHPEVLPGTYIMLNVIDNGTGMTWDVQRRIFEPFFTTKPKGSGTGLGLATVHGIVRQIGGSIEVYSKPGSGTTFQIYLPVTNAAVPQPQGTIPTEIFGNETILLVEDQEQVRILAVTILERYGYEVLSAASGNEALALAAAFQGAIHLLITDVVMPGMDGRALASTLAAQRTVRVLYMSGYTEDAVAHRGILDTGVDYIQKPFTPESLAIKVREVLDRLKTQRIQNVEMRREGR
jgi:two-component system cell cycle sensor histidine kinase/response regulator CckA